jgi:hypothetical protein
MQTLYVTNRWERPITFSHNFKPYTFPVGETIEVPEDAVRHIFGHGDANKQPYLVQLALIQTQNDIPKGMKALEKILITDQPPKKDHSLSPVVERVPLPERAGGKTKPATTNG